MAKDSKNKSDTGQRIFGLDLIRAIAIILVLLVHSGFMLNNTYFEGFPWVRLPDGVDVFFVLSGFLIGSILLKEIHHPTGFDSRRLARFWKRRWFRTLPNYYLILLANYLVVRYGIINEDIDQFSWHFLVFTQNLFHPFYGFFWESWSLSIEEWFYLLTPILILGLMRFIKPQHAFLIATLVMILAPLIYRISIANPEVDYFWWDLRFRKTVVSRLDSIGYGLLAAWLFRSFPQWWHRLRWQALVLGCLLIVMLMQVNASHQSLYMQGPFLSLIPIAVMLFLPAANAWRSAGGLISRSVEHISKISYSMYLINLALVAEVIRDNFPPEGGMDGIMKYLVFWVVVITVSTLLYRFFEKPVMDLRDRIGR